MFWGVGALILPLTLVYTLAICFVFKDKIGLDEWNFRPICDRSLQCPWSASIL